MADRKWSKEADCYGYEWRASGRGRVVVTEAYTQHEAAQAFKKKTGFEPTSVVTTAMISAF